MSNSSTLAIRPALAADVAAIFGMIHELAVFEKLEHMILANEAMLHDSLFGPQPACEALVGVDNGEVVTFAIFFHNFSTFLCRKGLYLEDLYVKPAARGKGYGKQMLVALAQLAVERNCGRFEWSVLDWNAPSIAFYDSLGASAQTEWIVRRLTDGPLKALAEG